MSNPPTPTIEQTLDEWLVHDTGCSTNLTDLFEDCTCIAKDIKRNLSRELSLLITKAELEAYKTGYIAGNLDGRVDAPKATTQKDSSD